MEIHGSIEFKPGELRCRRCLSKDLAPSLPRGLLDWLMRRFDCIPRHCRACGKRFYVRASRLERSREKNGQAV